VIRYTYLAAFAFAFGASPLAFTIYRVWSALHGMCEHANIRLPQWLDTAITFVFSSPNMHKIHHSRHQRFTTATTPTSFRSGIAWAERSRPRSTVETSSTASKAKMLRSASLRLGLLKAPFRRAQGSDQVEPAVSQGRIANDRGDFAASVAPVTPP
jgi:Sterol desaturase